jgi:hypothetical protein
LFGRHRGLPLDQCQGFVDQLNMEFEGKEYVWRFKLMDPSYYPDGNAEMKPPIPVEIRARKFEGFISNGDLVHVTKGKWGKGGTLEATELRNETTNSTVIRK